jgi:hypothetical protein
MQKPLPQLQKRIFWDVDFENINYDESPRFVIERVFERGDVQDIREVRRYYGDEVVQSSLTKAKWLRYDIFVFCKNLFGLKPEDFRCYTSKQLSQIPWHY